MLVKMWSSAHRTHNAYIHISDVVHTVLVVEHTVSVEERIVLVDERTVQVDRHLVLVDEHTVRKGRRGGAG
jgi:hypothetical protein